MMPRPRSRKKPVDLVPLQEIADEVARVTEEERMPPVAIVVGTRDWQMCKRQVNHRVFVGYWPGGEETFQGIPVIVKRTAGAPVVVATQAELDEMLLGA